MPQNMYNAAFNSVLARESTFKKNQEMYETSLKNIQLASSNASPYTYISFKNTQLVIKMSY